MLQISIPCYLTYSENKYIVSVPSLHITYQIGDKDEFKDTLRKTLQKAIGATIKVVELVSVTPTIFTQKEDNTERFMVEFSQWQEAQIAILEKEPLIETADKKRREKLNSHLTTVSSEDVVKYGYPDPFLGK